jgi:hypothetical protein
MGSSRQTKIPLSFVWPLYIYTDAALREKPELYNDTIYQGRK